MTKPPKRSTRPGEDPVQGPEAMSVIPIEHVQSKILLIRGGKVILDADLARLYGVQTRVLGQAVKRNIERFPPDFMFQLTKEEFDLLRSQTVISNKRPGRGGRRCLPYAFTEHGAIMAKRDRLENKVRDHDEDIIAIVEAIRLLMPPPDEPKEPFGFRRKKKN